MRNSTLAAIDGALTDYATSKDAMRWTPERVICDGGKPFMPARWNRPLVPPFTEVGTERIAESGRHLQVTFTVTMEALTRAMGSLSKMFQSLSRAILPGIRKQMHTYDAAQRPRWHRRNCRQCNPRGNPPPEAGKYGPGPKAARTAGRRS